MTYDRHMKRSKNGKYVSLEAEFRPLNESKYLGNKNPRFRSKLEFRAMCFLDKSPNVINWNYENFYIPYVDPTKRNEDGTFGKKRKYIIDLTAEIKTKTGTKKVWIEIKSKKETVPPKHSVRKNPRNRKLDDDTWRRNKAKWTYARALAKKRGCEFIILTEDQLK